MDRPFTYVILADGYRDARKALQNTKSFYERANSPIRIELHQVSHGGELLFDAKIDHLSVTYKAWLAFARDPNGTAGDAINAARDSLLRTTCHTLLLPEWVVDELIEKEEAAEREARFG